MGKLSHHDIIAFLIAIAVMLIFSRLAAEAVKRIKMPIVLGEILVGIILGPTVFGAISPEAFDSIFPFVLDAAGHHDLSIAMDMIITLSIIMLLFVAGMEVELPLVVEQGKAALSITLFSMIVPIGVGYAAVWYLPDYLGIAPETDKVVYAFFIGVVLSITALPVIARILMDMGIFKSRVGMTIIASAMFVDMLGWLIFSVLLTYIDTGHEGKGLTYIITAILIFGAFMLTIGSKLINKALPWVQTKFSWPGGVLALALGLCFLGAAFTEYIGIHSILGAFIVGIAFGDSANLRSRTREIIEHFVTNVFAPLFFVSIGLYVNFIESFNIQLVLAFIVLGYITKIGGAVIGARLGGLKGNNMWSVGMAMNTHGALEIILGTIALNAGFISQEVFVAIVIFVIMSIITAAPTLKPFIESKK